MQPILVTIVNHQHNDEAVALVKGFRPYADVVAIDSGSQLAERHQEFFDIKLPNVFYCGLLNAAFAEITARAGHSILYFICSDVQFQDFAAAIALADEVFRDPQVGVYAPSATASGHPQMLRKRTGGLRKVVFVEGFCFAVRVGLLRQLCPIDTNVNALGWGVDAYLGFLALQRGLDVVVDDRLTVVHQAGTGYSTVAARKQSSAWFALQSKAAQRFRRLTGLKPLKTAWGLQLLKVLKW